MTPSAAYFVSWTRLWELGIGALLAGVYPAVQRFLDKKAVFRGMVAGVGLLLIAISALVLDGETPFPGVAATLPVLGTAFVIAAAIDERGWALARPFGWKPVQFLGDISYSLYLWHWPAVVLIPLTLGRGIYWWEKLLSILVLILISWLTKIFVEDRFRGRRAFGAPLRNSYVFMAIGMLLVVGVSASMLVGVKQAETSAVSSVEQHFTGNDPCFGSLALVSSADCVPHGESLITDPTFALEDKPEPYQDDCWVQGDFSDPRTCNYGSDDAGALKVALVGNSHAGHWLPALQQIDKTIPWNITTYLISECYTVNIAVQFETPEKTQNCLSWNHDVITDIESGDYDLVVFWLFAVERVTV